MEIVKNLGTEAGVTFIAKVGKHMNLEFGVAIASIGDAGRAVYNAGTMYAPAIRVATPLSGTFLNEQPLFILC